jgi:hypothetical protein
MLLGDWEGTKYQPFLLFKTGPAKTQAKRAENDALRHGFGETLWKREIKAMQALNKCQIYGNRCAWWNSELSIKFLKFHFGDRPSLDENVLLLWDDFSGHWTPELVVFAASINVMLLKIPPYVCQPADISWNKPFKGGLRALWISNLRKQLVEFRSGAKRRQEKRDVLQKAIDKARKELVQADVDTEVERLHAAHSHEAFKPKPRVAWKSRAGFPVAGTT